MIKITGLDSLQQKLTDLEQKAKDLDGKHNLPLSELLTDDFISGHTKFTTLSVMLEESGFKVDTPEDFAAIPVEERDRYINVVSDCENWQEMLGEASKEWSITKLGLR